MYFAANALARKMEKMASEAWKKVNLSPSHGYLLMLVIDRPGVQPTTLSEELQLTPSTITRLIDKLEQKKFVVRISEGKLINVYPSPKGRELMPRLKACLADFCERYARILGKEESAKLVQNMNRITDKLIP
jgi:MarR family transcriptional regulator, organic hydroperoxide resistance regulator